MARMAIDVSKLPISFVTRTGKQASDKLPLPFTRRVGDDPAPGHSQNG